MNGSGNGSGNGGENGGRPNAGGHYRRPMPELTVTLTHDELDALRRHADAEDRPMESIARDAVLRAVGERSRRFEEAAAHVLRASAELNRRLA